MSAGGPTWETAGTLTLGTNTFAKADATEVGTVQPYYHGWWVLTPTADGARITLLSPGTALRIYTGDTEATKEQIFFIDGTEGITFDVFAGTTYHILVGLYALDSTLPVYTLTYTSAPLTHGPWIDDLQDDPDNYIIISKGTAKLENPNPTYATPFPPAWTDLVIRGGQGRVGDYKAQEVLGGDVVIAAQSCVLDHARNGDDDVQSWNTSTVGAANDGPGVCRPVIPGGLADERSARTTTGRRLTYQPTVGLVSGNCRSIMAGTANALWFLPVRDNLPPYGALYDFSLDPVDYGYPEDAVIQWEYPEPELLRIELGDGDPVGPGDEPYETAWYLNSLRGPIWETGGTGPWRKGNPADLQGFPVVTMAFNYDYGDVDYYHEMDESDGWDGHGWVEEYIEPDSADGVIVAFPAESPTLGQDQNRTARPAVKFVLQARRFRFFYPGSSSVIRQYPRDDNRGWGSGTRLYPPTKANRTVGGIQ